MVPAALWLAGCHSPPAERVLRRYEFGEAHMGTWWQITLYAADGLTATNAARAAFARVAALDRMMTDYDPESELMRLCRGPTGVPIRVSPDLMRVLARSEELHRQTQGAFDITAGPVVQLWRRARRQRALPDEGRLAEAMTRVGMGHLRINAKAGTVTLLREGLRLDLGGIAKGYGADEALRVMRQQGIRRALVAASGDLALGDPPPGKAGWRVGIGAPESARTNLVRVLLLSNCGVSTSGDTEQFVELGGVRYGHIVDPRTGRALTNRLQATLIAPNATTSDVMATAVCVLGLEEGLNLIERHKELAACVITRDGSVARGSAPASKSGQLLLQSPTGGEPGTASFWLFESRRFPRSR